MRAGARPMQFLNSLIGRADAGVGLVDERGKFIAFNRAAEHLLGIKASEAALAGRLPLAFDSPALAASCSPLETFMSRAIRGQEIPKTELFIRQSQGGVWINAAARPLLNNDGDVCGGVIVFEKIASSSRPGDSGLADSQLGQTPQTPPPSQESEPRRDAAAAATTSRAFIRRHRSARDSGRFPASGRTSDFFKEEEMSDATLNLTFSSPINHEVRHVVRLIRSEDLDGGKTAAQQDAAQQAAAQPAAVPERSKGFSPGDQDHIRLLLDSAAEAICEIDLAGDCTFANPACAKLLGYAEPSLLIGKNMHSLTHPRHADGSPYPETECPIHRNYLDAQGAHVEEEVFWRADGTSFYAECRSLPILQGNRVIGAVVTFFDVSERRRLEEQLERVQSMEAVGQLVGGIAHDFNNFLTAINIYNELLTTSLGSNVPAQQLLREIKEATERSASLTRQLLAFGQKQPQAPQRLSVNEVVQIAERLLRRVIGGDVDLKTSLAPELDAVTADPEQLERVLLNLVVNARHAMPQGGAITIASANASIDESDEGRSLPPGRYVVLSVTDTGSGMSPEVRRRVFDPYFTTKAPGQGTGLGLAVVQSIIKQLKGRIEVDSEPGRGACFRIYLPSAGRETPPAAPHDLAWGQSGAETILYVDRDDAVRRATCQRLREFGLNPLEARNVNEALLVSSRRQEPISLLVTGASLSPAECQSLAERLYPFRPELKTLSLAKPAGEPSLRCDAAHESAAPHVRPPSLVSLSERIRQALEGLAPN